MGRDELNVNRHRITSRQVYLSLVVLALHRREDVVLLKNCRPGLGHEKMAWRTDLGMMP